VKQIYFHNIKAHCSFAMSSVRHCSVQAVEKLIFHRMFNVGYFNNFIVLVQPRSYNPVAILRKATRTSKRLKTIEIDTGVHQQHG